MDKVKELTPLFTHLNKLILDQGYRIYYTATIPEAVVSANRYCAGFVHFTERYVKIYEKLNSILTVSTLAHEYGHIISMFIPQVKKEHKNKLVDYKGYTEILACLVGASTIIDYYKDNNGEVPEYLSNEIQHDLDETLSMTTVSSIWRMKFIPAYVRLLVIFRKMLVELNISSELRGSHVETTGIFSLSFRAQMEDIPSN